MPVNFPGSSTEILQSLRNLRRPSRTMAVDDSMPHVPNFSVGLRPDYASMMGEEIRVLVVEDQPTIREAITAAFDREQGFRLRQAASLADARAVLGDVDIAILDLRLPDGDGASLIEEIKAISPVATVIVLTSSIDPAEADRALERGADVVLKKLTDLDQLLATVKHLR